MPGARTILPSGLLAALLGAGLLSAGLAAPAHAGCTRTIINKSGLTARVSRDGGPWVTVPPGRSQPIRLIRPGEVQVTLACPGLGPDAAPVYRAAFGYQAIIDRCTYEFDDGFFQDYLGGGFFGFRDTKPLTLNNPRQGDMIIGPLVAQAASCPAAPVLRSRY